MQDILINWTPQETRAAIVEHGVVQELHVERILQRGLVGNVYLGRVSRVLPGMQSAFIDIGLERAAFLHVADVWQRSSVEPDVPAKPIEKLVFEGQTLLVQVMKDPMGSKGARLTTQISIAGRLMVFLPQEDSVGVSQKIPLEQRSALRDRVQQLQQSLPNEEGLVRPGGYIVRTNAEDASDAEIEQDMRYLRKVGGRIRQMSTQVPAPSLLHQDLNLMQRVLRDMVDERTSSIKIDSRTQYDKLLAFGLEFMPAAAQKLEVYAGERPIFDLFNIDQEITRALGKRVDLKCGGYLIIDQTEALTTIDVNTGGYVGARNFDETIFKTNLEAAEAIARQLRLRNLGGIIVADFIDMVRPEHQEGVLNALRRQLHRDRIKTMVGEFSLLGLVEMTRKRTRESLARMLSETCPTCGGSGMVKTSRSVAYDILREVLRESRQFDPQEFRVLAAPAVIDLFLGEDSQHLAGLSEFIGKPISLQADAGLAQDQYDVVLL